MSRVSSQDRLVRLAESAAEAIRAAAGSAHPQETGGILLGVKAGGRPWITQIVEIATPYRGRSHYHVPRGTTSAAVRAGRTRDPRIGYLGEWHVHPADVGPSLRDRATMRHLAHLAGVQDGPLLMVARRSGETYWLDVRQSVSCLLRRCELVLTGDLDRRTANAPPLRTDDV
jgi:hypothetical protein